MPPEIEITKAFRFEAAHSLPLLPKQHKCHHLHGHSYEVLVAVKGPLDPILGWVQDYAVISAAWQELIHSQVDHKNLNDVLPMQQTTAENLAIWLYETLKLALPWLSRIEVRETATSNVIYAPRYVSNGEKT